MSKLIILAVVIYAVIALVRCGFKALKGIAFIVVVLFILQLSGLVTFL